MAVGSRVIVVEDDASMRQALERLLDATGFSCTAYACATRAVMGGRKAPTPNAAQPTVTLKNIAGALAERHGMARKRMDKLLNGAIALIVKHLKKGDRIRIAGLGTLQVRSRAVRMGRNPATGEPIKIKASKKVAFRAAKDLKEAV